MTLANPLRAAPAGSVVYDVLERVILIALGTAVIWRMAPSLSLSGKPANVIVLISELLAIVFIVLRRPAARVDQSIYAMAIALIGTSAPLLVSPAGAPLVSPFVGFALMASGLVLSLWAKLALNRSFGLTAANRGVQHDGPYRLLRHPMYAGYVTTHIGFLLINPSAWNFAVYVAGWAAQLLRIRAEERVLREDAAYRAYAAEVRFRLLPGVF